MKPKSKIYNNYLYISKNNLVLKDNEKYYETKLSSKIMADGIVLNKELFINHYINFLKENKLSKFLWNKKINIIHDGLYSANDKKIIKKIFSDIGYKKISVSPLDSSIKLNKKDIYLINDKLIKLYYIDKYNIKRKLYIDTYNLEDDEIKLIIKNRCQNKNLIIINENDSILNLVDKLNVNYYYFNSKECFFLKNF